jgi:hypothetical protein
MPRLVRRLLILTALIGALIFLSSPQRTRADFDGCDTDLFSRVDYCGEEIAACELERSFGVGPCAPPHTSNCCSNRYSACLDDTQALYNDCLTMTNPPPKPLSVIDESRQQCLLGCERCQDIEDGVERFACNVECGNFCNETYPRPN